MVHISGLGDTTPKKDYKVIFIGIDDGGGLFESEPMTLGDATTYRDERNQESSLSKTAVVVRKTGIVG